MKASHLAVKFSIIIPVKAINDYVTLNLQHINAFSAKSENEPFEVLVLPNNANKKENALTEQYKFLRLITTGKISPGEKRDWGAKESNGEILVFLDDDSFPESDFLQKLSKSFDADDRVIAVGGPGVTPERSTVKEKASGAVYMSRFSGGFPERYRSIGSLRQVWDWPSVNLSVRKEFFIEVGGFGSKFWPGDDTHLCYKLMKKFPHCQILYDPDLIVMHFRRGSLAAHVKQAYAYGLHRGYFFKVFPENSRKIKYCVPSTFLIFLLSSPIIYFYGEGVMQKLVLFGFFIYGVSILFAMFDALSFFRDLMVALLTPPYVFCTHIAYGFGFLLGLSKKDLVSKLR